MLARPLPERAAFLTDACAGDEAVRREVDSLLAAGDGADSLLKTAGAWSRRSPGEDLAVIGKSIGPYQILAKLGEGGMGEVYRARDPRVGRDVAIKILPPEVADDPDRLRRFEQEARAAAALNHPNILSVRDVGADNGVAYLVTELLEGRTLREAMSPEAGLKHCGGNPQWSADGKQLFFHCNNRILTVDVTVPLRPGPPREVFSGPWQGWTIDPSGRRLLVTPASEATTSSPITVITNWIANWKK